MDSESDSEYMSIEPEENFENEEVIRKIYWNYIRSNLFEFFPERIAGEIGDPHPHTEMNCFSFIVEYCDIDKGICESKSFIRLAFTKMMETIYNESYCFSSQELDEESFTFFIVISLEEMDNIEDMVAGAVRMLKEKIIFDIDADRDHLRRDLKNGRIPSFNSSCSKINYYSVNISPKSIVNHFSLRWIHIDLYHAILKKIVQEVFPKIMTDKLENSLSRINDFYTFDL